MLKKLWKNIENYKVYKKSNLGILLKVTLYALSYVCSYDKVIHIKERLLMNLAFNKKLVHCVKNDFADNNINLTIRDTANIINNFSEFSKLIILLDKRKKEGAKNVW